MVCFQPYISDVNNTCAVAVGGPQCSLANRCTHTDTTGGVDESTLQTCNDGLVTISLYRNSSSCRASKLIYSYNSTTNVCGLQGPYAGVLSCGR
jgi:hypothetical protein